MFCQLPTWQEWKRVLPVTTLMVVVIPSHDKESPQPESWDQSAKGDGSALENHSPGLVLPVGNLKLGLRELNSS